MNILVTGGAGYIGSHTAKALSRSGYTPVVLDNFSTGHRHNVKWGPCIEGNISDSLLVAQVLTQYKIKAVLHFAASAYISESVRQPMLYFENNVVDSLALLRTVIAYGISSFVFSSSCATYGVSSECRITEEHLQAPINPYGESKLFIEKVLQWYAPVYGLRSVSLRYFNAAGCDPDCELGEEHSPETHLIPLAIGAAQGWAPALPVHGDCYDTPDGTPVRDFVHVSDLATAHVSALAHLLAGRISCAYNLGNSVGHSVQDVLHAVARFTGRPVPTIISTPRPGDPARLIADSRKARSSDGLNWSPKYSFEDIIQTAVNWFAIR